MSMVTVCDGCKVVLQVELQGDTKREHIKMKGLTVYRGDLTGYHPAKGNARSSLDFCSVKCMTAFTTNLLKGDGKKGTSGKQKKPAKKTKT